MQNNTGLNSSDDFKNLTDDQREIVRNWIFKNFNMIKTFNLSDTSYGLKALFENSPEGFYVTNGQFKGAMLDMGYEVKDKSKLNWCFNVSKKSVTETRLRVYQG